MSAMASQITSVSICLHGHLFRRRSKKTSKLRVTGLCEGNPPVTGGFPSQRASNAENVYISWCHHVLRVICRILTVLYWACNTNANVILCTVGVLCSEPSIDCVGWFHQWQTESQGHVDILYTDIYQYSHRLAPTHRWDPWIATD